MIELEFSRLDAEEFCRMVSKGNTIELLAWCVDFRNMLDGKLAKLSNGEKNGPGRTVTFVANGVEFRATGKQADGNSKRPSKGKRQPKG